MSVKQFFYFDVEGVASLVNQTPAFQRSELGLKEINDGEFGDGRKKIKVASNEQELTELHDYLHSQGDLNELTTLHEIRAIAASSLPAFYGLYDLPLAIKKYAPQSVVDGVLEDQFVLMQAPESIEFSIKLVVGAGLAKFIGTRHEPDTGKYHFGRTSHLAILLRDMATAPVHVNVFGQIRRTHDNFHVKPYAIWF